LKLLPLACVLVFAAWAAPASAHHKVRVKVIASGLDNPRHVAVSNRGDVYVAEAGRGGDPATATSCFDSAEGASCTGATGAITKITARHGHVRQKRVIRGLASFAPASGDSAIGPHGIFTLGRHVFFTNGGPTGPTRNGDQDTIILRDPTLVSEDPISRLYGTLRELRGHNRSRQIADLWRFERRNNPDAGVGNALIDSNPVDVFAAGRGRFFVADAGGNTVLKVSRHGRIRVVHVFPNKPTPGPQGTVPMQAVPTGVVAGPRRALYVSQLTGFPFPIGGAKVFKVDPRTGATRTYASGFTNIMDLAFGRDGTLYVLEIRHNSLLSMTDTSGALWAVPRGGGTPRQIALPAGTLTEPGGLAVGRHHTLYVSNHGREAGTGEVLRIGL
jgi:hypothetical protein